MLPYLSILLVIAAIGAIFGLRPVTAAIKTIFHANPAINQQIKFQPLQIVLALLFLGLTYLLSPQNFARFVHVGDLGAAVSPIPWLGITGRETWGGIALSMGFFITLGTGIFMFLLAKKAGARRSAFLFSLLWAIPFSVMNAFSEEAICRLGIVIPLFGFLAAPLIAMISGVLFGLPHYFGYPSKLIGVLMAGFLGWLLALSLLETQGVLVAWAVHFAQDVVIFTSLFMIDAARGSEIRD